MFNMSAVTFTLCALSIYYVTGHHAPLADPGQRSFSYTKYNSDVTWSVCIDDSLVSDHNRGTCIFWVAEYSIMHVLSRYLSEDNR